MALPDVLKTQLQALTDGDKERAGEEILTSLSATSHDGLLKRRFAVLLAEKSKVDKRIEDILGVGAGVSDEKLRMAYKSGLECRMRSCAWHTKSTAMKCAISVRCAPG